MSKVKKLPNTNIEQITDAISQLICTEVLLIKLVEADGFLKLMNPLKPQYKIPARTTFLKDKGKMSTVADRAANMKCTAKELG